MVVPSCTRVMMLQKFPSFYLTNIFFQQNLSSWQFHVVCNSKIPVDFLHFKLLVSYINDPPSPPPPPPTRTSVPTKEIISSFVELVYQTLKDK